MNKEDITITARCVKCDGISEIPRPSEHVSENIECQNCGISSHASLWIQMYINEVNYKERNEWARNELKAMTDDRDDLRSSRLSLKAQVDKLQSQLYFLREEKETAILRLSKEKFLTQFVLNRAGTKDSMIGGESSAVGIEEWSTIQKSCNEDKPDVTDREQEHG